MPGRLAAIVEPNPHALLATNDVMVCEQEPVRREHTPDRAPLCLRLPRIDPRPDEEIDTWTHARKGVERLSSSALRLSPLPREGWRRRCRR